MTKEYSETVLKEFPVIEKFEGTRRSGVWKVRVIEDREGKRWLDIREHLSTPDFTGFTKKGVRLNSNQFKIFMEMTVEIQALL